MKNNNNFDEFPSVSDKQYFSQLSDCVTVYDIDELDIDPSYRNPKESHLVFARNKKDNNNNVNIDEIITVYDSKKYPFLSYPKDEKRDRTDELEKSLIGIITLHNLGDGIYKLVYESNGKTSYGTEARQLIEKLVTTVNAFSKKNKIYNEILQTAQNSYITQKTNLSSNQNKKASDINNNNSSYAISESSQVKGKNKNDAKELSNTDYDVILHELIRKCTDICKKRIFCCKILFWRNSDSARTLRKNIIDIQLKSIDADYKLFKIADMIHNERHKNHSAKSPEEFWEDLIEAVVEALGITEEWLNLSRNFFVDHVAIGFGEVPQYDARFSQPTLEEQQQDLINNALNKLRNHINKALGNAFDSKEADDNESRWQDSFLKFDVWYHPEICHYLLQMTNNQAQCLRVNFADSAFDNNTETFKKQLSSLILLANLFDKPAVFIGKEPGANNHFVCGLIKANNILLINPLGITLHDDCYRVLGQLQKEGTIDRLWLSSTAMQRRMYEETLVSCGPISLEIATHLVSQFTLDQILKFWSELPINESTEHAPSGVVYHGLPIEFLLPKTLTALLDAKTNEQYRASVCAIRQKHVDDFGILSKFAAEKMGVSTAECLIKCLESSPAQVVFFLHVNQNTSADRLPETEAYKLLQVALNEPERPITKELGNQGENQSQEQLGGKEEDNSLRITC